MNRYLSKKLYHNTPDWVPDHSIYHIRIRCHPRQRFSLLDSGHELFESVQLYADLAKWNCFLFLLMPDHLHALMSFSSAPGMTSVIRDWKKYRARFHRINWQDGFFDHRIRNQQEYSRTHHYILNNPVARSLCQTPEDWPWKITSFAPEAIPHF